MRIVPLLPGHPGAFDFGHRGRGWAAHEPVAA